MDPKRNRRRQRLRADRARMQRELGALEIELMRYAVRERFVRSFPNATVGYPLYDR